MGTNPEIGDPVFLVGAERSGTTLLPLMHGQRRPVYLFMDGHPSHRTKLVKEYVDSLEGRLKLFFLPPHSPELNPDELVWNDVKDNAVGCVKREGPKDLHRAVLGRLRFLQKRSDRVRSFFRAPETGYAAAQLKVLTYWLVIPPSIQSEHRWRN